MSRIGTSRLIAFSISMLLLHPDNSASAVSRPGPAEVVMTLPVGDAGIHYNTWGESGTEYSGPTALACGPRGSFFIADAVANRVIWLRANEGPQAISLDGFTASVADIQWDGQELWVLDLLGSAVLELSTEGRIVSKTSLAADLVQQGLTGLARSTDDGVVLEFFGGDSYLPATAASVLGDSIDREPHLSVLSFAGRHISVDHGVDGIFEEKRAIRIDARDVAISSRKGFIGAVTPIGMTAGGHAVVTIEEIARGSEIAVDQVALLISSQGAVVGKARIPYKECVSYIPNPVTMDDEGRVYALVTLPDRLEIRRLSFTRSIPDILPDPSPQTAQLPATETGNCRSRDDMAGAATGMVNARVDLSKENLSTIGCGAGEGRKVPNYLVGGRPPYRGIPYAWGNKDDIDEFKKAMRNGDRAGDTDEENPQCPVEDPGCWWRGNEKCSRGIDCSGAVLRWWGRTDLLKTHNTTRMLEITTPLADPPNQMRRGDCFLAPGVHVMMFDKWVSNNLLSVWESSGRGVTTDDKTAHNVLSFRQIGDTNKFCIPHNDVDPPQPCEEYETVYEARRYNNVCGSSGGGSLQVVPPPGEAFSGGKGGPFSPPSIAYGLSDSGSDPVSWTATSSERWLTVSPSSGTVPGLSSAPVYVSVNDRANKLATDRYKATLTFVAASTKVSRQITLTVNRTGRACSIDVKWPVGGETLAPGATYTIAWSRTGSACASYVWVDLYQNGAPVRRLGDYKSGTTYQWTVPMDILAGGGYRIRVVDEHNSNYWGESPDFVLGGSTGCGPVIESPNGGESCWRGVNTTIYWHWNGTGCGPAVNIDLYRGSSFNQTVAAGIEGYQSGSTRYYTWPVPASLPLAADYKLKITDAANPSVYDWSDGSFSVTDPPPCTTAVLSPNGGESWVKGTTHTVSWDYSGNCHGPLAVDLYKGSSFVRSLISGIYGKSIEWNVPTDISAGNDYRIKVTMQGDSSQYDFSDGFFALTDPPAGSWQVISTIALTGTERPSRIAVSGNTAYVTRESGRLSFVDLPSLTETGTVTLSSYPGSLQGVAASGGRCYLADYGLGANGQVGVVDTTTRSVLAYVPVGTDPLDVALTSTTAYVTISQEAAVKAVDRASNSVVATIPAGAGANSIAIDAGSSRAYVTNRTGNSITIISTSSNSVMGQISTGSEPRGIALSGGRAFVALDTPAQIQAFDLTSGALVGSANVGLSPVCVATLPNYVFVTNSWSNSVSVLDPATLSTITTIGVGARPLGIAADPVTNTVCVVNYDSRSISVLRRQ